MDNEIIENGVIYTPDDIIYTDDAPACKFNKGVGCVRDPDKASVCRWCGWNPKVAKKRLEKLKR